MGEAAVKPLKEIIKRCGYQYEVEVENTALRQPAMLALLNIGSPAAIQALTAAWANSTQKDPLKEQMDKALAKVDFALLVHCLLSFIQEVEMNHLPDLEPVRKHISNWRQVKQNAEVSVIPELLRFYLDQRPYEEPKLLQQIYPHWAESPAAKQFCPDCEAVLSGKQQGNQDAAIILLAQIDSSLVIEPAVMFLLDVQEDYIIATCLSRLTNIPFRTERKITIGVDAYEVDQLAEKLKSQIQPVQPEVVFGRLTHLLENWSDRANDLGHADKRAVIARLLVDRVRTLLETEGSRMPAEELERAACLKDITQHMYQYVTETEIPSEDEYGRYTHTIGHWAKDPNNIVLIETSSVRELAQKALDGLNKL